jgi:4-diphosphocytidyl-2-C-methyl-D-erythritol kinase
VFLHPSPAIMSGRGELVEPCPWRVDAHFVIVYPGFPVSTAWAYRNFRLTSRRGKDTIPRLSGPEKGGISPDTWGEILVNDLEEGVLPSHPAIAGLKEQLLRSGARASLMSGSGSSVFGLFDDPEKAKKAAAAASGPAGREVFLVRPLFG